MERQIYMYIYLWIYNMAVATVREPVPVFISSSTGKNIGKQYLLSISNIFPYQFFIFFQYGKPYSLSISSRTSFSFIPVRETIFTFNIFQNLTLTLTLTLTIRVPVREELKNGYEKILRADMVSRTGRNYIRVREDIESGNGFTYWKKLNTGTSSRTLDSS